MRISNARTLTGVCLALVAPLLTSCGHVYPYKVSKDLSPPTPSSLQWAPYDSAPPSRYIALSGGGYRAMLYGLGVLWRLNDLGALESIDHVDSVSGGSILAAYLALHWHELKFVDGRATNFYCVIAKPILELSLHTVDAKAIAIGMIWPGQSASSQISRSLSARLFKNASLQAFPVGDEVPDFHLFATDLETGYPWVFGRLHMGPEGRPYLLPSNMIKVSDAVAASAGFPPFLSPAVFDLDGAAAFVRVAHPEFVHPPSSPDQEEYVSHLDRLVLADGGLVNNLGTEQCSSAKYFCVVSDAGTIAKRQGVHPTWFGQASTVVDAIYARKEANLRIWFSNRPANETPFAWIASLSRMPTTLDDPTFRAEILHFTELLLRDSGSCKEDAASCATAIGDWAAKVHKLWRTGYMSASAEVIFANLTTVVCNSQIATRLAHVDSGVARIIVDLGYIQLDNQLFYANWLALQVFEHDVAANPPERVAESIISISPGQLATPLEVPYPVEAKTLHELKKYKPNSGSDQQPVCVRS